MHLKVNKKRRGACLTEAWVPDDFCVANGASLWYERESGDFLKGREPMRQTVQVRTTTSSEMIDITRRVQEAVDRARVKDGICVIFVPHTTAAVTINENADPNVAKDILAELGKVVPLQDRYQHVEGNSAAHIKASLVGCSKTVFVESGRLVLGTWQAIFFCEFDGPRNRTVQVKVIGGAGG
jgi:secondary thiamine-phosphate synthase enzyme